MKMKFFIILFVFAIYLSLCLTTVPVLANGVTLYEHFNTDYSGRYGVAENLWQAQTFTAESNHSITSVKLRLGLTGSPGDLTVSIRETDSSGEPTGSDLTSGTIDGNTFTDVNTDADGEWYEIFLTTYSLTSGSKYAIIIRATEAKYGQHMVWWFGGIGYDGGRSITSWDSGDSWMMEAGSSFDKTFEIYGDRINSENDTTPEPEVGGDIHQANKAMMVLPAIVFTIMILSGAILVMKRRYIRNLP